MIYISYKINTKLITQGGTFCQITHMLLFDLDYKCNHVFGCDQACDHILGCDHVGDSLLSCDRIGHYVRKFGI